MARYSFQIGEIDRPLRVDQYLARQKSFPSRSQIKPLFDQGRVLINGDPARASTRLRPGDMIIADLPETVPSLPLPEPIPISILYEDDHLIVVDKPAGLLTHPTPSRTSGTLVNALLNHCGELSRTGGGLKPGVVHRLDKQTSGVMVAAKSDAAHRGLAAQFKAHTIDRRYLALVHGEMEQLSGRIETGIGRNPAQRLKMTGRTARTRKAITRYCVLGRKHGFSLIECRLETGRTHQIRVHLAESNHPVVGDSLYGRGRVVPGRLDPEQRAALGRIKRQALHARHLGFTHPVLGEWMAFASPLPEEIRSAAAALDLIDDVDVAEKSGRVE